jgi:hypothetical protein
MAKRPIFLPPKNTGVCNFVAIKNGMALVAFVFADILGITFELVDASKNEAWGRRELPSSVVLGYAQASPRIF